MSESTHLFEHRKELARVSGIHLNRRDSDRRKLEASSLDGDVYVELTQAQQDENCFQAWRAARKAQHDI